LSITIIRAVLVVARLCTTAFRSHLQPQTCCCVKVLCGSVYLYLFCDELIEVEFLSFVSLFTLRIET